MKQINWSKKDFADFLGIVKTTISKRKTNNKVPKYAIIAIDYLEDISIKNEKIKQFKKG